ncbi:hypothetical protein HDU99_003440 [Rhizoclosmatium hyalinum]|nr:hypothetical protein HDU99_003440 [Rhizoclosmatium hyalinum]
MAMKSPRVQVKLDVDDDDDLCPVCDGDCTCSSSRPTIPKPLIPATPLRSVIPSKEKTPPSIFPSNSDSSTKALPKKLFQKPIVVAKVALKNEPQRQQKIKPLPSKVDEPRRMLTCLADVVVDSDGHPWKAKTASKKLEPREFGRMLHIPSPEALKSAPMMEKLGAVWVVHEIKKLPVAKPISQSIFDSSSEEGEKMDSKSMKSVSQEHYMSSSDMDSDTAVIFSESSDDVHDEASMIIRDTDESGNELCAEMAGPPFVEQHSTDDCDDDSESESESESNDSVESLDGFLTDNSDEMEIDRIFAAAGTDDGSDASESDMDMFVENALYGGWSSSDELDDSDEDSVLGHPQSDSHAGESITDEVSPEISSSIPVNIGSDTVFMMPEAFEYPAGGFDYGLYSQDIHTLDPSVDDAFFGSGLDDVSFEDVVKVETEPVIATKPILSVPVKPKKKRPKQTKNADSVAGKESVLNDKSTENNTSQASGTSTLSALKSALSSIIASEPSQRNSNLVNTLVSSLKNVSGGSSTSLALLLESWKTNSDTQADDRSSSSPAVNIAALAVIAAAVTAAKRKADITPNANLLSVQDATVSKALEDFLAAALPAMANVQKLNSNSVSTDLIASASDKAMIFDDLFDMDAADFADAPDENERDLEQNLEDPFSRWNKIPIGTFRKARRPSLSSAKHDFKKAFRNSNHTSTMTLPPASHADFWKSQKVQSALVDIPPLPSAMSSEILDTFE